jgi:predicted aldo/keto reductase-like oxidoreductase
MQYRKFGNQDFEVSALGFGAMRFPTTNGDSANIDEAEAVKMLRYAIDRGVNYVDTAYPYHEGQSEVVVGQALKNGYREKVKLVTKMPCWLVESPADFDKYLNEQLERLQTDHIDFYLLHALFTNRWEQMQNLNVLEWSEKAVADGRIGALGFSFHDSLPLFKEIVDAYEGWGLCQIQYNFMNEDVQAGTEGLEYAAQKGLPVVIMEPLLGGIIANPPAQVQEIWDNAQQKPVDVALRWLWNKPGVSVVLSGMSNMEQVEQNLVSAEVAGIGTLTANELDAVKRVQEIYKSFSQIACTKCGYCMPCPNGLDIPRNFELYNEGVIYDSLDLSQALYTWHMRPSERADACIACGDCEVECPQKINISEWMPKVHDKLLMPEQ